MSLIAAGITSFEEVPEAAGQTGSLNLHLNQLRSLAGAARFSHLKELILSSNGIASISDLEAASRLEVLDLSGNNITRLSGLWGLTSLSDLSLAFNRLESLSGLESLWGPEKHLRLLDLRQNCLREPSEMLFLGGCTALEKVWFRGARGLAYPRDHAANAVCSVATYRQSVLEAVPWLLELDDEVLEAKRSAPTGSAPEGRQPVEGESFQDDAAEEASLRAEIESLKQSLETYEAPAASSPSSDRAKQLTKTLEEVSELEAELGQARARNEELEQACRSEQQLSLGRDLSEIARAMQRRQEEHDECRCELEVLQQQRLPAILEEERRNEEQALAEARAEAAAAEEFRKLRSEARALVEEDRAAQAAQRARQAVEASSAELFGDLREMGPQLARSEANLAKVKAARTSAAARRLETAEVLEAMRCKLKREEEAAEEKGALRKEQDEALWKAGKTVALEMQSLARELASGAREVRENDEAEEEAAEKQVEAQRALQEQTAKVEALRTELKETTTKLQTERQRRIGASERAALEAQSHDEELKQRVSLRVRGWRNSEEAAMKAVRHKEEQLEGLQQRLSSHRATLRIAEDQSQAGRAILQELRQQLISTRHHESEQLALARSRLDRVKHEEQQAATLSEELTEEGRAFRSIQAHLRQSCVARSLLDAPKKLAREASDEAKELRTELQEAEQQNGQLEQRLEARRSELREVGSAHNKCEEEHEKLKLFVKIKEQMIAHTHRQTEEMQVATLRLVASQKERDASHHKHLEAQCQVIDQCGMRAAEYRAAVDTLEEEMQEAERALQAREEGLNFAEEQLEALSALQEEQDRQAALQAAKLREEGQLVVAKAEEAAAEMEKRFVTERAEQASLGERLELSMQSARRELASWPGRLEALRQHYEEQKREARESIAALLRSL